MTNSSGRVSSAPSSSSSDEEAKALHESFTSSAITLATVPPRKPRGSFFKRRSPAVPPVEMKSRSIISGVINPAPMPQSPHRRASLAAAAAGVAMKEESTGDEEEIKMTPPTSRHSIHGSTSSDRVLGSHGEDMPRSGKEFREKVLPKLMALYKANEGKGSTVLRGVAEQAQDMLKGFDPTEVKKCMVTFMARGSSEGTLTHGKASSEKEEFRRFVATNTSPSGSDVEALSAPHQPRFRLASIPSVALIQDSSTGEDTQDTPSPPHSGDADSPSVSGRSTSSASDDAESSPGVIRPTFFVEERGTRSSPQEKRLIRDLEIARGSSQRLDALLDPEGIRRSHDIPKVRSISVNPLPRHIEERDRDGYESEGLPPRHGYLSDAPYERYPKHIESQPTALRAVSDVESNVRYRGHYPSVPSVHKPSFALHPRTALMSGPESPVASDLGRSRDADFFKFMLQVNEQHHKEQQELLSEMKQDKERAIAYLKEQLEASKAIATALRDELKELDATRDELEKTLAMKAGKEQAIEESDLEKIQDMAGKYLPEGGKRAFGLATAGATVATTFGGVIVENTGSSGSNNSAASSSDSGSDKVILWWLSYAGVAVGFLLGLILDIMAKEKNNIAGLTQKLRAGKDTDTQLTEIYVQSQYRQLRTREADEGRRASVLLGEDA